MGALVDQAELVAFCARNDEPGLAALELARFEYPHLEPATYLSRLDDMAARVEIPTHLGLRRVLAIAEGIGGNVEDYYAPDNGFLHRVLDTRKGSPIVLSVIWMEVGRRVGVEVVGVGLPGHFVVYVGGQMVDPFHYGEAIGFDEAAALVGAALGGPPRLDRSWLSPVGSVETVGRMLRNLAVSYEKAGRAVPGEWIATCLEALGEPD